MAVEHEVLAGCAILQHHAFSAGLVCHACFFLGFRHNLVHTFHGDVIGVLAVALHIVVVIIRGRPLTEVNVIGYVGSLGGAVVFFFRIFTLQYHISAA